MAHEDILERAAKLAQERRKGDQRRRPRASERDAWKLEGAPTPPPPKEKKLTARQQRILEAPTEREANYIKARQNLTQEAVIEAITSERGMILHAANTLGVSRKILREYIADHAACADAYREARESMGDVAEYKLYDLIEAGDVRCIMYYLSTVHRERGYGLKAQESLPNNNQTYVGTVNIVSIPSGQFLDHNTAGVVLDHKVSDRKIPAPYAEIEKASPPITA